MNNKKKVYFVSSLVAKNLYAENFKLIADTLRELHFEVYDDVNKTSPEEARNYDKKRITEYYKSVQKRIKESDLFIAELSQPSSAVGYEIGYAVANDKPVLVLRLDTLTTQPGAPLRGNPSKLLVVYKYNKYNLKKKIQDFIKKVEKGMFVKRLPIEFTQEQVDYIQRRQKLDKKNSFNSTVRMIIDDAIAKSKPSN